MNLNIFSCIFLKSTFSLNVDSHFQFCSIFSRETPPCSANHPSTCGFTRLSRRVAIDYERGLHGNSWRGQQRSPALLRRILHSASIGSVVFFILKWVLYDQVLHCLPIDIRCKLEFCFFWNCSALSAYFGCVHSSRYKYYAAAIFIQVKYIFDNILKICHIFSCLVFFLYVCH